LLINVIKGSIFVENCEKLNTLINIEKQTLN